MIKTATFDSDLGIVMISTFHNTLTHLSFVSNHTVFGGRPQPDKDIVNQCMSALNQGIVDPELSFSIYGSTFQLSVWNHLQSIPAGSVASYKDVAQAIGSPGAVRAVGTACGANPIAVIIPCHRVIRSDGKMGEYRWGLELKNKLLEREKLAIT